MDLLVRDGVAIERSEAGVVRFEATGAGDA